MRLSRGATFFPRAAPRGLVPEATPSFREAFLYWLKLGFVNFGGPTGQIALMHRDLVERKRWISEERFLHALNYCMLLPGPEAMQLAVYAGWLLHGTLGGIVAGLFFFLPSVFALLALSWAYAAYGGLPLVAGLLFGLKAVVLAVVAHAAIKLGRKALRTPALVALAALAFLALHFAGVPFPLVVLGAGLVGFMGHRVWPRLFPAAAPAAAPQGPAPSWRRAGRIAAVGAALWLLPLALLLLAPRVLLDVALFMSGLALVTFGGAYAALAYMAQAAVEQYGWLSAAQMVDGLGLAETTPGPLIMVVGFIGYMAGWSQAGTLPPTAMGTLGLLVAVYFTFLPSFLFIFLGAPHVERLRGNKPLAAALSAITAAVVGVIVSLAVFFAQHVLWGPAGVEWAALALAAAAFLVLWLDVEVALVVLAGGLGGLAYRMLWP